MKTVTQEITHLIYIDVEGMIVYDLVKRSSTGSIKLVRVLIPNHDSTLPQHPLLVNYL